MRWLAAFVLLMGLASGPVQAGSERNTELVMFELGTCIYCAVWNDAVGHTYDDTLAGKRAPLRRVFLTDPRPDDLKHVLGVRMTPTFVLLDEGREVGRIHGYANPQLFWNLLSGLLQKMTEERG
jgi:thioredoxin-related protein